MEPLRLYNTLSRTTEDFKPLHGKKVGLYTCGPTVYSTPHIGNFRSYIFADILRRTLGSNGYDVTQVINITDVGHLTSDADEGEDKLEKGARTEGQTVWDVAAKHTKEFQDGFRQLNILLPDVWANATDHIEDQIAVIEKLVANGHTYETRQALYFDISTFERYGRLSGQKLTEKMTGARSDVVTDAEKKHPADFALWFKRVGKFSDHVMHWPSPWGEGFPGWHIECSAMSMKYLGDQFDIHTGGIDHIAVHHENEIAQSEGATGRHPFVRYWMHNEFLTLPGKRMGKSEGNSITLQSITDAGISPLAFRYLCLQTHYRKSMLFTWESLEAAAHGLNGIYSTIDAHEIRPDQSETIRTSSIDDFISALNDDLNTSQALAVLHAVLRSPEPWATKRRVVETMDRVLALGLLDKRDSGWLTPTPEQRAILDQRQAARDLKDWSAADALRDHPVFKGAVIVDTETEGQRLRKSSV